MQTQDIPGEFLFKLWPWLEENKNRLIGVVVAIIILSGIFYFISSYRHEREIEAGEALTALSMNQGESNPSQMAGQLEQVATKYAGTAAGERAALDAAGALYTAGNFPEAEAQFKKYLDGNASGPLAATAELGYAASLEAQNKLAAAAAAYQRVKSAFPDSSCVPSADLALGRIAEAQNQLTEALNHYEDAARGPSGGSVAQEAFFRASELRPRMAAASKAAAKAPGNAGAPAFTLPQAPAASNKSSTPSK